MMDLDLLRKALTSLKEAWQARTHDPSNPFLPDACIQRFEYTYELSHKTLRRFLEATEADPDTIQRLSFPNMIRYRHARSLTSHTYDAEKSEEVLRGIPAFLEEADFLLAALTQRLQK